MFAEYNRKHADDPAKELNLDAASFSSERFRSTSILMTKSVKETCSELGSLPMIALKRNTR